MTGRTASGPEPEAARGARGVLLLALLATGIAALFAGKPFHIDDPHFLRAAAHVAMDPLHPLDFEVNLDDRFRPAREVFASPPGFFYLLALLLRLGLEDEVGIHVALAPFAGLLVWATARLARSLGERPLLPCALVACSPAALLTANNVMPDMFAAATGTMGAALWLEGTRARAALRALSGGLLLAVSAFSRYGAIAAPAGLALFGLLARLRDPIAWSSLGLAPAVTFLWTALAGGGEAVSSLSGLAPTPLHAARALAMAAHLGLAAAPTVLAFGGRMRPELRALAAGLGAAGLLAFFLPEPYAGRPSHLASTLAPAALGAAFLFRLVGRSFRGGDAANRGTDALLAAWILLTLALPTVYVHASAKYLVPALPALALAALRIEPPRGGERRRWAIAGTFLLLGLGATVADARLARAHRTLAERTVRPLARSGRRVWFAGHWGFQWYAEKAGARCYDATVPIERGDLLVIADIAHKVGEPKLHAAQLVGEDSVEDSFPIRTMSFFANAGFYSHAYGLLPFGLSRHPLDQVVVVEAR